MRPSDGMEEASGGHVSPAPSSEAETDLRLVEAEQIMRSRRLDEAARRLEALLADPAAQSRARALLLATASELKDERRIAAHIEPFLLDCAHAQEHERLCKSYRSVRTHFPRLGFSERALVVVLAAGEYTQQGRVILDATKLLMRDHAQSPVLPRALMRSAAAQQVEGRSDLATQTLQALLQRFPQHGARRRGAQAPVRNRVSSSQRGVQEPALLTVARLARGPLRPSRFNVWLDLPHERLIRPMPTATFPAQMRHDQLGE